MFENRFVEASPDFNKQVASDFSDLQNFIWAGSFLSPSSLKMSIISQLAPVFIL